MQRAIAVRSRLDMLLQSEELFLSILVSASRH